MGLGGVGWGNDVHVNLHTHTHTSCYVIVMFSCTCTHTRHATLWLSWGGVGWGGVGWGNDVHVNLHTHTSCYVIVMFSCTCTRLLRVCLISKLQASWKKSQERTTAHHCFCRWKPCLGITCQKFENQTCQSVSSKQRMDQTNAKNLLFFPVHCGRDANR